MKRYCLLLSIVFLANSYSRADVVLAHHGPQTNDVKSATIVYVPKAKVKVQAKIERAKAKIRRKIKAAKDKVLRKVYVPQATTNYNHTVAK